MSADVLEILVDMAAARAVEAAAHATILDVVGFAVVMTLTLLLVFVVALVVLADDPEPPPELPGARARWRRP